MKLLHRNLIVFFLFSTIAHISAICEEITPYKFTETLPEYEIPKSSRFTTKRQKPGAPEIVYYLTKPHHNNFPIVILCEGSSDENNIASAIHFHRYFLKDCIDLGAAVLTVERWGVDGNQIDKDEWIKHYTRSQRLEDHRNVIQCLKTKQLIQGWNGKLIFIGVSEGGPLVTSLSAEYSVDTIATINWSGAGDCSWREELWVFIQNLIRMNVECPHSFYLNECQSCLEDIGSKAKYDVLMNSILKNPKTDEYFFGMTYLYHSDALVYPLPEYQKLTKPFLVVGGALDTIIESTDAFVQKAKNNQCPITYLRISDMDHYVRKRPDVIEASFAWLEKQIANVQ